MIDDHRFSCEPWAVRETSLDLDLLGQTESIFALSNGHIGWRANLDEGEPHAISGSYLNGVYEEVPLPYAETAYGYPEAGQAIVNVTDGKVIRLLVGDEPFDVRYGRLISHERTLDFKSGLLTRDAEWESPAHLTVRVRSTRLVSPNSFDRSSVSGPWSLQVWLASVPSDEVQASTGRGGVRQRAVRGSTAPGTS